MGLMSVGGGGGSGPLGKVYCVFPYLNSEIFGLFPASYWSKVEYGTGAVTFVPTKTFKAKLHYAVVKHPSYFPVIKKDNEETKDVIDGMDYQFVAGSTYKIGTDYETGTSDYRKFIFYASDK
ncbi:hypothetical protein [uncultured Subdoligranulum sp.]|uniref:hypothetical protein n=1 Tax=uncultured Subdoligranulum sp. TaxID=512298 RepID=UPI0025EA822C|nr:hypothetical protein [uncultured Subdoligranulum sp.]